MELNHIGHKTDIQTFQEEYFSKLKIIDPVIQSYNQIYDELGNIIQKFDMKYQYQTQHDDFKDELLTISINLKNPKIIKPGETSKLSRTSVEAISHKKDFMCIYQFDTEFVIKLRENNRQNKLIDAFVNNIMIKSEIKEFTQQNQIILLEKYFDEYLHKSQFVDEVRIPSAVLQIELPVMTMSKMDPVASMTPRQRYDAGCDVLEIGGDIILGGIPYLIQNWLSYPNNMPIIAKSTLPGQIIRADYLYQQDPLQGNNYNNIFLLISQQIKRDKTQNIQQGTAIDLVLNFKQKHDIYFKESEGYIPVSLLFRAYGCDNDAKLLQYCNPMSDENTNLFFIELFQEGSEHQKYMGQKRKFSQLEALYEIGKIISKNQLSTSFSDTFRLTQNAIYGLSKYISPIVIGEEAPYCQALGGICYGIYQGYIDPEKLTDRDALYNKRIVNVGQQLISELRGKIPDSFKSSIRPAITTMSSIPFNTIKSNPKQIEKILSDSIAELTKNIYNSIKKSFTSPQQDNIKILKNLNEQKTPHLSITQKREVILKSSASGAKMGYGQRKLQKSFWAFLCYLSTPDSGENVGKYLTPTIYSTVSLSRCIQKIQTYLFSNKLFTKQRLLGKSYMSVNINYNPQGYVLYGKDFKQLYNDLMMWRQKNAFLPGDVNNIMESADQLFVSIYYSIETSAIHILTDANRLLIPIFKKKSATERLVDLIISGDCQFVCSAMIQNFIVEEWTEFGKRKEIKWCFGPSGCLGLIPAVNPLQFSNKAIRSTMSISQIKSSQSQVVQNYSNYYMKNMLVINQNQSEIIYAPLSEVQFKHSPITQMVFLAIMPYTDNQEDAVVISEDFVARYGFATTALKCYASQCQNKGEQFQIPVQVRKEYDYSKVNQNLFQVTKMGTTIKFNDVLISKVKQIEDVWIDQSTVYDNTQPSEFAFVCNQNAYTNNPMINLKMVRVALCRIPSIGDKVASRNAQKSIIEKIIPGYLMPITEDGIIVNMIQDTNGVSRRETYGQILELLLTKWLIKNNKLRLQVSQDQQIDFHDQLKQLEYDKIYQPDFDELFINPEVLCGPFNYTVQKHVVDEKIRVRSDDGKVDAISKQSQAGKKNSGGLKIGDMERNALCAGGVSNILVNFFGKLSSDSTYYICLKCGTQGAYYNKNNQQYYCQYCGYILDNQVMMNGFSYNGRFLNHILNSCGIQSQFVDIGQQ